MFCEWIASHLLVFVGSFILEFHKYMYFKRIEFE